MNNETEKLCEAAGTLARFLGLKPDEPELPLLVEQMRLAEIMAAKFVDFSLPDDAEPASLFAP